MRVHRITSIALVALITCHRAPVRPPTPAAASTSAHLACAAVEAAVDSLVPRRAGYRLALMDSTMPAAREAASDLAGAGPAGTPGLDPTTWASFVANNRIRQPACAGLPSGAEVVSVSDTALRALSRPDADAFWRAFYARFPRTAGLTSTSGVGVSADGRQALVYLTHGCGGLCGHGHVVLLEREPGGAWRVRYARMTWVS